MYKQIKRMLDEWLRSELNEVDKCEESVFQYDSAPSCQISKTIKNNKRIIKIK